MGREWGSRTEAKGMRKQSRRELLRMPNGRFGVYRIGVDEHGKQFKILLDGHPRQGFETEKEALDFARGVPPKARGERYVQVRQTLASSEDL